MPSLFFPSGLFWETERQIYARRTSCSAPPKTKIETITTKKKQKNVSTQGTREKPNPKPQPDVPFLQVNLGRQKGRSAHRACRLRHLRAQNASAPRGPDETGTDGFYFGCRRFCFGATGGF